MFHLRLFVDTDSDVRLSRRVLRDVQRGRDLEQILTQYTAFVKPAFEEFCLPRPGTVCVVTYLGSSEAVIRQAPAGSVRLNRLLHGSDLIPYLSEAVPTCQCHQHPAFHPAPEYSEVTPEETASREPSVSFRPRNTLM